MKNKKAKLFYICVNKVESEHLHSVAQLVLPTRERVELGLPKSARLQRERREDLGEGEERNAVANRLLQGHTRLAIIRDFAPA